MCSHRSTPSWPGKVNMASHRKECGDCTLCCDLVGVGEIDKPPFTVCRFLSSPLTPGKHGCTIYKERPRGCRQWSCLWLTSPDWPDELRPDRCGVVVDPLLDVLGLNGETMACGQIWVARGHEDDFNKRLIMSVILGFLEQVPAILWRMAPGKRARAIVRRGEAIEISPSHEMTENAFGGERNRDRML